MATYGHVILFSLAGGIFSLLGGILLLSRKKAAEKIATYVVPFAAGALLAAVFLDLLPEGVEHAGSRSVMLSALIGILIFFFAERFLHWFHHHHQHTEHGGDPARSLIIIGDAAHNVLDGMAIAAAFLISVPTGIVTTIAVAAHEIPQEIGDFGLLLNKGMSRAKVLIVNVLTALLTTLAAVVTFALGSIELLPVGVILGLSAGFLLYIATSDIIPEIHERTSKNKLLDLQPFLLLVGVVLVGAVIQIAHQYIDTGHDDHGAAEHSAVEHEEKDDHHEEDHHEDDH